MGYMKRSGLRPAFTFDEGETAANEVIDITEYSAIFFVFPAEFDGDTITLKTDIEGDDGFTITAATGRYNLTQDELAKFFPMNTLTLVTDTAVSAAASITYDLKS